MPALNLIVGANATQFSQAMNQVVASAAKAGTASVAALQKHAKEIQATIAAAKAAGTSTDFYSAALRKLNSDIAVTIANEQRLAAAMNRTAEAGARSALGMARPQDSRTVAKEARKLRQTRAGGLDREVRFGVGRSQEETQAEMAMLDVEHHQQRIRDRAANMRRYQQLRLRREGLEVQGPDIIGTARAAARKEATAASIEQATRDNRARQLRRQRAQERADHAEHLRQTTGVRGLVNRIGGGVVARFAGVGAAIGAIYSGARFVKESVEADIAMQRIKNTLLAASGNSKQAAGDFEFLLAASKKIGFSFADNADNFARFSIAANVAGMSAAKTRDVFTSVMEASAVMGLSSQRTGEAMLALEQMLSKGKVSAQELRLQLGNAVPSSVNTMAKALGLTMAQLFTAVESGSIESKDAVEKFAAQLRKDFQLTDEANVTIRNINRLKTAIFELKAQIGEGSRGPLSALFEGLTAETSKITFLIGQLEKLASVQILLRTPKVAAAGITPSGLAGQSLLGSMGLGFLSSPLLKRAVASEKAAKKKMIDETAGSSSAGSVLSRDAEAASLSSAIAKQTEKENKLNDALNRRLLILDLLNDRNHVSAANLRQLEKDFRSVNEVIAESNERSPLEQTRTELRALVAELAVARNAVKNYRGADTPEKSDSGMKVLRATEKSLGFNVTAKRQELGIQESRTVAPMQEKLRAAKIKNDEEAMTPNKRVSSLEKRQASLFSFIQKNRRSLPPEGLAQANLDIEEIHGELESERRKKKSAKGGEEKSFSLGNLTPARAGTHVGGPQLRMLQIGQQQLAALHQLVVQGNAKNHMKGKPHNTFQSQENH